MKYSNVVQAFAGALLSLSLCQAQAATTISFETGYSLNGQEISKTFGSIVGIVDTRLEDIAASPLLFWSRPEYSGKPVAFSGNSVGIITLTPASGLTLTLDSFFLGAYPNFTRKISYSVDNLDTPGLEIDAPGADVNGATGLVVAPGMTTLSGVKITFGPDGLNGGINYITYTTAPIPEPGTWVLLVGGLAFVATAARRRDAR